MAAGEEGYGSAAMVFAYADPPYWKSCRLYGHEHGDDGRCWDKIDTHLALVARLEEKYPDGWAISMSSNSLRHILPACPPAARVASWTKPMCAGRPGIFPVYSWEPVVFSGGRKTSKGELWERDSLVENSVTRSQFNPLIGTKPTRFCRWVANMLGYQDGDHLEDLFPGSGVMERTLAQGVLL